MFNVPTLLRHIQTNFNVLGGDYIDISDKKISNNDNEGNLVEYDEHGNAYSEI